MARAKKPPKQQHTRKLTVELKDGFAISFTEAEAKTEQGVAHRESEKTADKFETLDSLAQAVAIRIGGFYGSSPGWSGELFGQLAVETAKEDSASAAPAAAPQGTVVNNVTITGLDDPKILKIVTDGKRWVAARRLVSTLAMEQEPNIPAIQSADQSVTLAMMDLEKAILALG